MPDTLIATHDGTLPKQDRALPVSRLQQGSAFSPASIRTALADWAMQLARHPARQSALAQLACQDALAFWQQSVGLPIDTLASAADDHRFTYPGWQSGPFALAQQSFLRAERWWQLATTAVPGVTNEHERLVAFLTRQMLDAMAPSNIPTLNPEVIDATIASHGANLGRGAGNYMHDLVEAPAKDQPLAHPPGRDVAVTPGKVVLRNALIELIQYTPSTGDVRPEPILIVPAWIMKFYILDLSPANSFIRYLVGHGYTVFCISWLNPGAEQRDVSLDDYRTLGVMAALAAVTAICGEHGVHALGYCLGGTLLSIAAAAMARDGHELLASLTLLAAQTDFSEAGALALFTTESQLGPLDEMMAKQGYLDGTQMSGAFAMLRANDLIWGRINRRYYLGKDDDASDMMSWDADATRMPFRMQSEYLHKLYLHNDLAGGRMEVAGRPVSVAAIHAPCFIVSAETDWVAPWRSVYKFLLLSQAETTFILASGGHNGGVVSVPGAPHRHYRMLHRKAGEPNATADVWLDATVQTEGSWWPACVAFLGQHSSPAIPPPPCGNPSAGYPASEDAPGQYVLQR